MPAGSHGIPTEVVESCREAVVATITMFWGQPPTSCADARPDDGAPEGEGVLGTISFMGAHQFHLSIGLPASAAEPVAEKFLGMPVAYDAVEDMNDLVGELTNVVGGDLRARLEEAGIVLVMGLPEASRGLAALACGEDERAALMRCSIDEHWFWIKLAAIA